MIFPDQFVYHNDKKPPGSHMKSERLISFTWYINIILSLYRSGYEALLYLSAEEDVENKSRERSDNKRRSNRSPIRGMLTGKCLYTNRKCSVCWIRNEYICKHELIPALQIWINSYCRYRRLHKRKDDHKECLCQWASVNSFCFSVIMIFMSPLAGWVFSL